MTFGNPVLKYIVTTLQEVSNQPMGLLFSFLLGISSSVTSVCCTLPAIGILIGYSGTQSMENRGTAVKRTVFFTIGMILSLMLIGGVAGFVGQVAQNTLGTYWKLFAGIISIILGFAALDLLPFKLSFGKNILVKSSLDRTKVVLTGIILGGIVAVSSLPCNPGIFIVIGAAVLQGKIFWAILLLSMFAIGFSLPLSAVLLGISLSKINFIAKKTDTVVRWIAGIIMIIAGFYFLLTF